MVGIVDEYIQSRIQHWFEIADCNLCCALGDEAFDKAKREFDAAYALMKDKHSKEHQWFLLDRLKNDLKACNAAIKSLSGE